MEEWICEEILVQGHGVELEGVLGAKERWWGFGVVDGVKGCRRRGNRAHRAFSPSVSSSLIVRITRVARESLEWRS